MVTIVTHFTTLSIIRIATIFIRLAAACDMILSKFSVVWFDKPLFTIITKALISQWHIHSLFVNFMLVGVCVVKDKVQMRMRRSLSVRLFLLHLRDFDFHMHAQISVCSWNMGKKVELFAVFALELDCFVCTLQWNGPREMSINILLQNLCCGAAVPEIWMTKESLYLSYSYKEVWTMDYQNKIANVKEQSKLKIKTVSQTTNIIHRSMIHVISCLFNHSKI